MFELRARGSRRIQIWNSGGELWAEGDPRLEAQPLTNVGSHPPLRSLFENMPVGCTFNS